MGKILRFSGEIPLSIKNLILPNSPSHHASHQTNSDWLDTYGTAQYRNTIVFKGPLLHNEYANSCLASHSACNNINLYKKHARQFVLGKQSDGNLIEWETKKKKHSCSHQWTT